MLELGTAYFKDGHKEPIISVREHTKAKDIEFATPSGQYRYVEYLEDMDVNHGAIIPLTRVAHRFYKVEKRYIPSFHSTGEVETEFCPSNIEKIELVFDNFNEVINS